MTYIYKYPENLNITYRKLQLVTMYKMPFRSPTTPCKMLQLFELKTHSYNFHPYGTVLQEQQTVRYIPFIYFIYLNVV